MIRFQASRDHLRDRIPSVRTAPQCPDAGLQRGADAAHDRRARAREPGAAADGAHLRRRREPRRVAGDPRRAGRARSAHPRHPPAAQHGQGRARSGPRSSTCAATSGSSRTPISSTTRPTIPALVAPILEGKADAVFGSRFASASQRKILLYWHGVANHFLTWLTNILNDINLTDMETCYKAVRADILKQTPLYSNRFGIEPELTTKLAQWNIRLYEVPISYHGRTRRRREEDRLEGRRLGDLDADQIPVHRRSVHDPRRLLRAAEHAPRARAEPLDPRAVPPVHRRSGSSRRAAASATSPSCCSIASGWSAWTTIRSTSRWRTGGSATSRTCARWSADLSDTAVYAGPEGRSASTPSSASTCSSTSRPTSRCCAPITICSSRAATPSSSCPRTCGSTARATKRSGTCAATRTPSCTPRCRRPGSRS